MATPNIGSALSQGGLAELKRRLLFVLMAIIVFRIGSHVPVPGLDPERLAHLFSQTQGGIFGMFNMFSGGAFPKCDRVSIRGDALYFIIHYYAVIYGCCA